LGEDDDSGEVRDDGAGVGVEENEAGARVFQAGREGEVQGKFGFVL
jgi:hypothetical protein